MNITPHINSLLYKHDCVIVPEFGAFLVQYNSAKIDIEQHIMQPPSRSIRFNSKLKDSDGVLLNYLQTQLGVDEKEAKQIILAYVEDLQISLSHLEEIVLHGIGSFSLKANQLQFTPHQTNFLASVYGFQTLYTSPIAKEDEVVSTDETKVVALAPDTSSKTNYFKYAAVGLIALGISGVLGFNWYVQDVEKHNQQAQIEIQNRLNQKIQSAEFSILEPLPMLQIETKAVVEKQHIHIVGGAFREEANAIKKQKELQEKGFDAKLIGKNAYGLHQVAFASFASIEEAQIQLRKIKRNHLATAWLLVE